MDSQLFENIFSFSFPATADGNSSTVYDSDHGDIRTAPVPGLPGHAYVRWGFNDQLPYTVTELLQADEVTAQNKLFNVITCYGAGIRLEDPRGPGHPVPEAVSEWAWRQNLPAYWLEQATDMKHYYFSVSVLILSQDGRRVNRIVHKDACYCRLAPADEQGRIHHLYYANWRDRSPKPGTVERIALLDLNDPLGDLRQRMGLEPNRYGITRSAPVRDRKFAILTRFPTPGCEYYPVPYYAAIFRGGSYDEKRLISTGKRAKLRNSSTVKYQVEVEHDYWTRLCTERGLVDPQEMANAIRSEKEKIRDFVGGIENSGKVWITGYYVNPDGKEVRDIRITLIEGAKEGGDWADDLQAAANTICYGDNIHPNLVGATPGKSQMNNSGSDKRELYVMKQALEMPWHDLMLRPLETALRFNGWRVRPVVPLVQLTTLDEHRDLKEVKPQ